MKRGWFDGDRKRWNDVESDLHYSSPDSTETEQGTPSGVQDIWSEEWLGPLRTRGPGLHSRLFFEEGRVLD